MSCGLCGSATRRSAPVIAAPAALAGKDACDWCAPRLGQLLRDELGQGDFDALQRYANQLADPQAVEELEQMFREPSVALQEADAAAALEAARIAAGMAAIQVTSGYNFEGRSISEYLGFTSAEVVLGMGIFRGISADFANFFGAESEALGGKLTEAKAAAFERLRRLVVGMGGNAIIGTDLDYTMFGTSLVGVIASGTAVILAADN